MVPRPGRGHPDRVPHGIKVVYTKHLGILMQAKSLKWTETVVSEPDVVADAVADAVVPAAGAVTVVPDNPDADAVAAGAVTVGVDEVVVPRQYRQAGQPALQDS